MENKQKKNSDAKIRANNKYSNSHYKRLTIAVKPDEADTIRQAAQDQKLSLAQYIIRASNYIIDNNIDLSIDK